MANTLYRQWRILQMLPRYPGRIECAKIAERLALEDISVARRTLERDLCDLMEMDCFPIVHDEHKPRGWSWASEAKLMDIPGMNVGTAVMFRLIGQFLAPMLPKSALETLKPYEARATDLLKEFAGAPMAAWPSKVRVITRSQPLIPARVKHEVLGVVYEALLQEKKLKVSYRKAGAERPHDYELNPLGLVFRDAVVYLVCTAGDYEQPLEFLLHRMQSAEMTDKPRKVSKGFDLDKFIASTGGLSICCDDTPTKLKLLLDKDIARVLSETPVSKDQALRDAPDGRVLLEATVANTVTLRSWILSYGEGIEVVKPDRLRKDIRDAVKALARRYER